MKILRLLSLFSLITLLSATDTIAQTTVQIGSGTSSSSTRGPFQRSDTNSSSVYSRNVIIYTAAELATAGIISGSSISELQWEKGNSNVIIGTGNANLKLYLKNSSVTSIDTTDWTTYIPGSTLVLDSNFNTTNNFPSSSGWMAFPLNSAFTYTGGALEVAIDWDASQVSTPQFSGNGSVTWRWAATTGNTLAQRVSGSAAPTALTKVKAQRANIQIVYGAATSNCPAPTNLNAVATSTSAALNWTAATGVTGYGWKVVPFGGAPLAPGVDSGAVITTSATANSLTPLTQYDLYVTSVCGTTPSSFAGPYTFLTEPLNSDTITIGAGTSSSSTRGPFQRSDTNSSTVYSRWVQIFTASELAAAGITNGSMITKVNWELASSNIVIGSGDANMKVYIKNSSATAAMSDTWVNHISGSTLALDKNFNTTNNFPGANGWMPFSFTAPFTYAGGAIEVAVDWNCSQVSTPAFSGDGALKWRWTSTSPDDLVVKKTGSSSPSTTISDLRDERANIQFVYVGTTVGINELDKVTNLTLSPNPTSGITYFDLGLTENANVDVSILSITGKLIETVVQENTNQFNQVIDLSSYDNGVYFFRISINNQVSTKKIILVK